MSSVKVKAEKNPNEPSTEKGEAAADLKAAMEILATRIGGYSGTILPGGKRIK